MSDWGLARDKLLSDGCSCVLVREGNIVMVSYGRGIKPVFSKLVEDKNSLQNTSMADKVVGKALALLSILAGIKSVYGYVMSDHAKIILENNNVDVEYNKIVPCIMNRDRTDRCIMEGLVDDVGNPEEAFNLILDFFDKMQ